MRQPFGQIHSYLTCLPELGEVDNIFGQLPSIQGKSTSVGECPLHAIEGDEVLLQFVTGTHEIE